MSRCNHKFDSYLLFTLCFHLFIGGKAHDARSDSSDQLCSHSTQMFLLQYRQHLLSVSIRLLQSVTYQRPFVTEHCSAGFVSSVCSQRACSNVTLTHLITSSVTDLMRFKLQISKKIKIIFTSCFICLASSFVFSFTF